MRIDVGSRTLALALVVLGVVTVATPMSVRWATGGFPEAAPIASVAQASSQWVPQSPVSFLVTGAAVATPTNYNTHNSGRVSSLAVDPRDPARWLAGFGNGGVWETRDAGTSWTPITDDAPTLATGSIAFAAGNPDVIYVGTGESLAFGESLTHIGVGLLKSTNNGRTWALLGQSIFGRGSIPRVQVDPNNADVVLVALSRGGFGRDGNSPLPAAPSYGVLRSTDGGANWTRTLTGIPSALEVDPRSFSRQYAAIAVGGSPNGIYRSRDGGVSWSRVGGPWWPDPTGALSAGRIRLAIAPSNPDVVYAGVAVSPWVAERGDLLGLYRTENAWADTPTWTQVPNGPTGNGGYCAEVPEERKCEYSHVISVDPRDANTLFAGGGRSVWRCTNCGASPVWSKANGNAVQVFVHVDYHVLEWAGNRLITGNDGGVFSTTDLGATWQDHNRPLITNMFYMGALHPTDPTSVLGGARDFGVVTHRASEGWRTVKSAAGSGGGEGDIAMSSSRPNTDWMASRANARIHRTIDGGQTRPAADAGIDRTGTAFVAPVRKCPAIDDVFLAGTTRMWRTNNFFGSSAPSWAANSPDEPSSVLAIGFVEGDRSCNTYAYGTRLNGTVRLTRDGGTAWTDLDPTRTLPARPITSIAFDPTNPNRAFVALSSYDLATPTKPGHIYRSDNALSASPTWTRVGPPDQPFADMPFNIIAIDPRNPQIVYAGSDNGLWESGDGGTTWVKVGLGSGLPPASVFDIQINPTTNKTMIFTYGRGAFERVQ